MTDLRDRLLRPTELALPRAEVHAAVQPLSLAARANLAAAPDDSHSNLGWSSQDEMFVSQPLNAAGAAVGLRLAPLTLLVLQGDETAEALPLAADTPERARVWLDGRLAQAGLAPTTAATLPYDLPSEVGRVTTFGSDEAARGRLAAWYTLAATSLERFAQSVPAGLSPGPSPVRCWPHHFDIATYVGLAEGDPETASGIGVGLSPGDESYAQPYFYVNPWPHLDPDGLPPAIAPGHWHTDGFVGLIATGDEILTLRDLPEGTVSFLRAAFASGHAALGT